MKLVYPTRQTMSNCNKIAITCPCRQKKLVYLIKQITSNGNEVWKYYLPKSIVVEQS